MVKALKNSLAPANPAAPEKDFSASFAFLKNGVPFWFLMLPIKASNSCWLLKIAIIFLLI